MIVNEVIDGLPYNPEVRTVARRRDLLLSDPPAGPVKLWQDLTPLEAVHFPQEYVHEGFAPPRGVYESDFLRVEWQKMDFRQPFYHRNCDVDEISYQIAGERTLMTELGSVEQRPGDFSRIPVGVAHDNYGRQESHILFYVPAPVTEESAWAVKRSEPVFPPFPGWAPRTVTELVTECLGGPEHDVSAFQTDEQLLLDRKGEEAIQVLRAPDPGTTWLYRSAHVWIGSTRLAPSDGSAFHRHRSADEIQYQISGRRTLISQRGTLDLEPGDFVRVPLGCAFTSVCEEQSTHLTLLSGRPVPQVAPAAKTARR
ncbi:hypothetical protein [Nonomuraea lactucae]|uniref:hypothetical protein n=1 Tax=Nonomuraea lactucae TaxID=2249762 RepID=UPI000DE452A9|nr:hypothetical protein [Nonomuraea lactucae]